MKEYLIAVDLEGVHGVSGLPFEDSPLGGIPRGSTEYKKAVEAATQEINVVADELFACGATRVVVWDNHGGGGNIDFSVVDKRVEQYVPDNSKPRLIFLADFDFSGMLYLGYHSRAGSLRGVMSHTYNSQEIQYYKINGKQVGEFDICSAIAASYGVPSIFAASDDVCVEQISQCNPQTETAVTKIGVSRRKALFREENEVFCDMRAGVRRAISKGVHPQPLSFPCSMEIRYTKQEVAEKRFERLSARIPVQWGEDAHTLQASLHCIDDLRLFLAVF